MHIYVKPFNTAAILLPRCRVVFVVPCKFPAGSLIRHSYLKLNNINLLYYYRYVAIL